MNNLLAKTDRKQQTIGYGYDALYRLTRKTYPDQTAVGYAYDPLSRLTQVTDPSGAYSFTYDNLGRLLGTGTQYSFLSTALNNSYAYDAASNRVSFTNPESGITNYSYDSLNRLTALADPNTGSFTFGYDTLGRRTSLARPNGVDTSYSYDTLSRLLSVLHNGGALPGSTGYTYDAAGNRTSKTAVQEASPNPVSVLSQYSYDNIYELTQAVVNGSPTEGYTYDAVGNRLTSAGPTTYNYNSSNELTSDSTATFTYDNNGNTTSKTTSAGTTNYTWDFENRLTSVTLPGQGGTVYFTYDPFGRRIRKSSASGTTIYAYDGDNIVQELNSAGSVLVDFTQGLGIDEPLGVYQGATVSYFHADGLGSITSLTNGSGQLAASYVYDSFGNLTASTGTITNPFQYAGREFDAETGLYYYRARYYDSNAGRFLNQDPLAFGGGVNFYRYVRNAPTELADPSGLADVYIWKYTGSGPNDNWGHAGLRLANGTWISWWPNLTPGNCYGPFCDAPALPPSFYHDNQEEGTVPTIIHIDNLDEGAIQKWWDSFQGHHTWNTLFQNCSTTVAQALDVGGGRKRAPFAPHPILLWTPPDVQEYARQIRNAGQGQYIPLRLPQTGY